MKFADDFDVFLEDKVNLDDVRLTTLEKRVDAIESFILDHDSFGEFCSHLVPAGSWAFRTIIKPVQRNDGFDADVLVPMTEQDGWSPKDYVEELYKAFKASATYKDRVQKHKRCVRIIYANEFHVDVVPHVARAGQHYVCFRLKPKDVGTFELSNPEGFTAWMDERSRASSGNFIKVVRLIKYLRDYKDTFTCVSIILTTLLGEQLDVIEAKLNPNLYKDVPTALVTLMRKLADSLPETMPAVMDPGGTGDNFTDRYKDDWNYENFRSMIQSYADRMDAAFNESDRAESIRLWRDIFGDEFKPGAGASAKAARAHSASVPWGGEEFIDGYGFDFAVPQQFPYAVHITGRVVGADIGSRIVRRGFREYDLATRGNRVSRHRRIRFSATTTAVGDYRIFWKVRNGGREAFDANALRGEITEANEKVEPTLYVGNHYVDCYVVQDCAVVARDRQPVIITPN